MFQRLPCTAFGVLAAALLLAIATPAIAATAPGSANLNLFKPLQLAKTTDMDFGSSFPPATGTGTIRLDPNGGATVYAGATAAGAAPTSRAVFTGTATRLSLVFLQYPAGSVTLTRVGGTETLIASNFTIDSAGVLRIVGTTPYAIGIGATLSVPSTAVDGSYLGTFTVTANYF
ncbi:DUF4402 domain-containing protein [Sphingomonas sp.]|uniref:DUF4402 domain-containing protein n=1 Tax=Sphingomonas sp. TaxID=28214 RepID=UPI00286B4A89|nr:DUF4402 domain-containing protein [Sphingomonas sp.]